MKSLVLYCKYIETTNESTTEENVEKDSIEFHINLWKTKNGIVRIAPKLIFDFGIKFDSSIQQLCLFLPFQITKKENVKDLGKCLSTNRELLNAVFNEDMICQSSKNHCFSKVSKNTENEKSTGNDFYIYHIGEDNVKIEFYTEESKIKGTYLTITIDGNPFNDESNTSDKKYYIRFRVYVKDINEVVKTELLSNDLLQAAFSRMDLYDIRLNEKREIPSKVEERMKKENFRLCTFNKLHFFYIVDTHETINNGIDTRKDSRLLENDQWSGYEPISDMEDLYYIAHHWKKMKKEKDFSHFSLFFTTIYPKMSLTRLFAYFSIVILLGWFGSMLSFSIKDLFCGDKGYTYYDWISPIAIGVLLIFLIVYIIKSNFMMTWLKLRRKL